jgi:hypothetical protein
MRPRSAEEYREALEHCLGVSSTFRVRLPA